MWGYSGGSLATGWAISLQLKYAPELKENLIGAAVGGFATNITAVAEAVDGTVFSGFIPLALNGLANEYPDFKRDCMVKLSSVLDLLWKKDHKIAWLLRLLVIR